MEEVLTHFKYEMDALSTRYIQLVCAGPSMSADVCSTRFIRMTACAGLRQLTSCFMGMKGRWTWTKGPSVWTHVPCRFLLPCQLLQALLILRATKCIVLLEGQLRNLAFEQTFNNNCSAHTKHEVIHAGMSVYVERRTPNPEKTYRMVFSLGPMVSHGNQDFFLITRHCNGGMIVRLVKKDILH